MASPKVMVTTTPSMEGWKIDNYIGPVFSHIVAGTGFFSDFAAGLSDIFGGRSQSYQRQLEGINTEAIGLLRKKASMLGGNLILGLRIDHDEISGKAKQMFMVTASGTAAIGTAPGDSKGTRSAASVITADTLSIAMAKAEILSKCKSIPISLDPTEWAFATENQVHEIAPSVLATVQHMHKNSVFTDQAEMDRKTNYFLGLQSDRAIPVLYAGLREHDQVLQFVKYIVAHAELFDFDGLISLLRSDDLRAQKAALALVTTSKPYYVSEDIGKFSQLVELIKTSFVVRAQTIEEKSKLTSSVKTRWVCLCGVKNEKDAPRCSTCARDIYGFIPNELTPSAAIAALQPRVKMLETLFAE